VQSTERDFCKSFDLGEEGVGAVSSTKTQTSDLTLLQPGVKKKEALLISASIMAVSNSESR